MINKLIKKYEKKINHYEEKYSDTAVINFSEIAEWKAYQEILQDLKDISNNINKLSDGYHTFDELYEFRKLYNASLFNEWHRNKTYEVYKSRKHHDNEECFGGGWFIVVAMLPTGQISNHYELEDWDLFKIPEYDKSKYEFDGHTAKDVLIRLKEIIGE